VLRLVTCDDNNLGVGHLFLIFVHLSVLRFDSTALGFTDTFFEVGEKFDWSCRIEDV
jgi:hypothetical protein